MLREACEFQTLITKETGRSEAADAARKEEVRASILSRGR
eukprot:gene369-7957_t